jgi:hypothetical protein
MDMQFFASNGQMLFETFNERRKFFFSCRAVLLSTVKLARMATGALSCMIAAPDQRLLASQ